MMYDYKQLSELNTLKHRHDSKGSFVKYSDKLFNNSTSPYLYNNPIMATFLKGLNLLTSLLFDNFNIIKNFKNYMVDKYDYREF